MVTCRLFGHSDRCPIARPRSQKIDTPECKTKYSIKLWESAEAWEVPGFGLNVAKVVGSFQQRNDTGLAASPPENPSMMECSHRVSMASDLSIWIL